MHSEESTRDGAAGGVFEEQPTRIAPASSPKAQVTDQYIRYVAGVRSPWAPFLMVLLFFSCLLFAVDICVLIINPPVPWFFFVAPIVMGAISVGGLWLAGCRGEGSTLTFYRPNEHFKSGAGEGDDGRYQMIREGRRIAEGRFSPDNLSVEPYGTVFAPGTGSKTYYALLYYPAPDDYTSEAKEEEHGEGFRIFKDDPELSVRQLLALCWQMGYRQEEVQIRRAPAEGLEAYREQRRQRGT